RSHQPPHSFPTRRSSDLGEQRREGLLLRADLLPQRLGENRAARIPPAHPSLAVPVDPDRHELVGLLDGKRAETERVDELEDRRVDRKSTRLNSSHVSISY